MTSGPGKPRLHPDEPTHVLYVRVPESTHHHVIASAAERGESAAEWVRDAIQQRLDREV